jgi:hypothetical protein
MTQTTFTRQKRELAKASALMEKLRAQEVRKVTFGPDQARLTEVRETYVDYPPEEIAARVLDIVIAVVGQHGARQRANSRNTGRFSWQGVAADLTVPQLRTLQQAHVVLSELVNRLPRRNPRLIPNATVEGHPAFMHPLKHSYKTKTRYVPFEEDTSTRVRSYEEHYEELEESTQLVEIDFGLEVRRVERLQELVLDLGTAIQVAIDEANGKGHESDPIVDQVINGICRVLLAQLPPVSEASDSGPTAASPTGTTPPRPGMREFL